VSDEGAHFDSIIEIDGAQIKPQVSWGTSPEMVVSVEDKVPDPAQEKDPVKQKAYDPRVAIHGVTTQSTYHINLC
jgi:3-isopropylmalate/(R)-2-methylmalate dehydratase large subunit